MLAEQAQYISELQKRVCWERHAQRQALEQDHLSDAWEERLCRPGMVRTAYIKPFSGPYCTGPATFRSLSDVKGYYEHYNPELATESFDHEQAALDDECSAEIEATIACNADLSRQILELERKLAREQAAAANHSNYGLGDEFAFGERYYECVTPSPGVGFRHSPSFKDKNLNGKGPEAPECICADRICQGPRALFIRSTDGQGWLPVNDTQGKRVFRHVGPTDEVNLEAMGLQMGTGTDKVQKLKAQMRGQRWFGKRGL